MLSLVLRALSAGVASSCSFVCFSVGAGPLYRRWRETDFGGLLRFLLHVLRGARLSLRVGWVFWGMSTVTLEFEGSSATRPWPTRAAHPGLPETALEDSVHPLEDPVHSLHYSVSSLGGPI